MIFRKNKNIFIDFNENKKNKKITNNNYIINNYGNIIKEKDNSVHGPGNYLPQEI